MRRVVIGGLLIGLLALAWYVDSLLARTLWVNNFVAETRSGDWYTGWPILSVIPHLFETLSIA